MTTPEERERIRELIAELSRCKGVTVSAEPYADSPYGEKFYTIVRVPGVLVGVNGGSG
jgi:hypothetical protein